MLEAVDAGEPETAALSVPSALSAGCPGALGGSFRAGIVVCDGDRRQILLDSLVVVAVNLFSG